LLRNENPLKRSGPWSKDFKKVLTVGCGTCVAVCLAGGEKEVGVLNSELKIARRMDGNPIETGAYYRGTTV
jgi:chemotaxis receptor (MCP) glutamine deamidase CheD